MKYLNSLYIAPCQICDHAANSLLYNVSSAEAARHFLVTGGLIDSSLATIQSTIKNLWKNDKSAVVKCNNCGFVFADPFIAGDHQFYNLLPHATAGDGGLWKWEHNKTYDKIARLVSAGAKPTLLEIGASTGNFMKAISKLIDKKDIFCLEYSTIGVNQIREMGISAESWNFRELKSKQDFAQKFDIICLFQVLEHLDNLADAFDTFNHIIKPGGHLFIGVPNGTRIAFNELNGALLDMPPNHIGRFNDASFRILGKKFDWLVSEIAVEPTTPLDIMRGVMYYRSLKAAQYPAKKNTLLHRIIQYVDIKYLRLQAILKRKNIGETLWVHLQKPIC